MNVSDVDVQPLENDYRPIKSTNGAIGDENKNPERPDIVNFADDVECEPSKRQENSSATAGDDTQTRAQETAGSAGMHALYDDVIDFDLRATSRMDFRADAQGYSDSTPGLTQFGSNDNVTPAMNGGVVAMETNDIMTEAALKCGLLTRSHMFGK